MSSMDANKRRKTGNNNEEHVIVGNSNAFQQEHLRDNNSKIRPPPKNNMLDSDNANTTTTALEPAVTMITTPVVGDDDRGTVVDSQQPFPEESLRYDSYSGVTIDAALLPEKLTSSPATFEAALQDALKFWTKEGKKGIWINIPTKLAQLIPLSVNTGFDFQLAKKGHVILTIWLPDDSESRLPNPPSHQVGVGALVLHPTSPRKMLVVQEKSGPAARARLWKMPTGLTDPGEDVPEAAVREVREETGLVCTFDRIVCVRQAHNVGSYGASDMFFVCLLRVDEEYYRRHRSGSTAHDMELRPQESEIAGVDWMEVDSFANQDLWTGSPLYTALHAAMFATIQEESSRGSQRVDGTNKKSGGFIAKTLPIGFRPASNTIYLSRV